MAQTCDDPTVSAPRKRYASAISVLPAALYREVQKHHRGVLYVGRSQMEKKEREDLIIKLRLEEWSMREIARVAGVGPRRVQQILAAARARGVALPRYCFDKPRKEG